MFSRIDARIPLVFGSPRDVSHEDALLMESPPTPRVATFLPSTEHQPGCLCCSARLPAGRALTTLLHARARAQVPYFRRVVAAVATRQGRLEVETCLQSDPVVATCFRLVAEGDHAMADTRGPG